MENRADFLSARLMSAPFPWAAPRLFLNQNRKRFYNCPNITPDREKMILSIHKCSRENLICGQFFAQKKSPRFSPGRDVQKLIFLYAYKRGLLHAFKFLCNSHELPIAFFIGAFSIHSNRKRFRRKSDRPYRCICHNGISAQRFPSA